MTLSVLGLGLCSPLGSLARDHAFFPRANAPVPPPAAFALADGRPFHVGYAKFVSPTADATSRLSMLVALALEEARPSPGLPLFACLPAPREGLDTAALDALAGRLGVMARASSVERCTGAASVFEVLARIDARGDGRGALIVGVDSFFHLEAVSAMTTRPPGPFEGARLPLAEGAGVLVVGPASEGALGTIVASRTALGRGSDEDDEPVDAAALTALLLGLPASEPIQCVSGQGLVDPLRLREWEWCAARAAGRFSPEAKSICIEAETGQVGAAAGVMALAYALASIRHGFSPSRSPLLAWAVSRDGTRGLALCVGGGAAPEDTLLPLAGRARARRVERDVLQDTPPSRADEEPAIDASSFDVDLALAPENDVAPLGPLVPATIERAEPARLVHDKLRPTPLAGFRAEIVANAMETLSMLGKARELSARGGAPELERRMLCQLDALVATGPRALVDLEASFTEDLEGPYRLFGGTIAALAFSGEDAARLVARSIEASNAAGDAHARLAAEALLLSDHPDLPSLGRSLFASTNPAARAAGLRFLTARGLAKEDELARSLEDASPLVRAHAVDACGALPLASRRSFVPSLRSRLGDDDRSVTVRAARELFVLGDAEASRALLDPAIAARLGPLAADLHAHASRPDEVAAAEAFFTRQTMTPAILAAAARFGRPSVLPGLVSCLADEELVDAAADALEVVLGALGNQGDRRDRGAWQRAIDALRPEPGVRLRRGNPWTPAEVGVECASGMLTPAELAHRVDELRIGLGLPEPVLLSGWFEDVETNLSPLLRAARHGKGKR